MIPRVPLGDEVYRQVLQRVQRGDIPAGARIRDVSLATQLGVSRTPIREALLRLARDGVLENTVGRGFRVRPLDPAELREVGAILGSLEALALRQVPRRYLAAFMRDAGRLSLSTLPHVKILEALRDGGRASGATVFEQQWHRGVAELELWTARASGSAERA